MEKLNAKNIREQAEAEVAKERAERAKTLLKAKLNDKAKAQTVLDNLNREIQDLETAIEHGNF
jgi:hypothetical protein